MIFDLIAKQIMKLKPLQAPVKPGEEIPFEKHDPLLAQREKEMLKLDAQIRYLQKQQRKNKTSP